MQSAALARRTDTQFPLSADNWNEPVERRAWPRTRTIFRVARAVSAGESGLCRIQNISDDGLLLMTSMRLTVGSPITLALSDTVSLSGRVIRTDDVRASIRFSIPIDSAALLQGLAAEQLSGTARQQRLAVDLRAVATSERGMQAVRVLNVSQHGMRIEHDGTLVPHMTVKVSLENGIERRGVVRWIKDSAAGLKLLEPISLELLTSSAVV